MLRASSVQHGQRSYNHRSPHIKVRWWKRRYLAPKTMSNYTPWVGRTPDEYGFDTHMLRMGKDWGDRVNKRGLFRHWPWVSMNDDPVGDQLRIDSRSVRAFSCKADREAEAVPRFDMYADSGRDYRMRATIPLSAITDVLHENVAAQYSRSQCERFIAVAAERYPTPAALAAAGDDVTAWAKAGAVVPFAIAKHLELICADVVKQHARKTYRAVQQGAGVLRTLEMERYYAIPPVVSGPAMPTTLAQAPNASPAPFMWMWRMPVRVSPEYKFDRRTTKNKMPA